MPVCFYMFKKVGIENKNKREQTGVRKNIKTCNNLSYVSNHIQTECQTGTLALHLQAEHL